MMKNKLRLKKGFTIIELIVVVAILGVLVLLAGPRLLGYVENAEKTRIQHDVKVMEQEMKLILLEKGIDDWDNNQKNLGTLIMQGKLFEKKGSAERINADHLIKNNVLSLSGINIKSDNEQFGMGGELIPLGIGGDLIETDFTSVDETYKIIPINHTKAIKTRLGGTFYTNDEGKVYYEHDKPLSSVKKEQTLVGVSAETLDYEFEIIDGKGTITGWNGTEINLIIPESFLLNVDGEDKCVPVQVIGKGAFTNDTFERVVIPSTVDRIEEEAFMGGELIEIEIPSSVEHIGENAFANNKLTSVTIPHSVDTIGPSAFAGNNFSSSSVMIINSPEYINVGAGVDSSVFGGVNPTYRTPAPKDIGALIHSKVNPVTGERHGVIVSLSSNNNKVITIPEKIEIGGEEIPVKELAQGAFQGSGLISVKLPSGLERIENYAFASNKLERIVIPESVGFIGNYAFAFNEVYSEKGEPKPTIESIEIKGGQYVDKLDKSGNITSNISSVSLKDFIFVTSKNNHVIEEKYEYQTFLEIIVNNNSYIDTKTNINVEYIYDEVILDKEWVLNGEPLDDKPSGLYPAGTYDLQLRVKDESGNWSKWTKTTFVVNEYMESFINDPNSTSIINFDYDIGANLVFNYTNNSDLNWTVPVSGTYKIDALGAGAGGKGARVQGEIELSKGDVLNFKIHQRSNGGGAGGNGNGNGIKGNNGSGGTLLNLNDNLIVASGGAGGNGARGVRISGDSSQYSRAGAGGAGGNGGNNSGGSGGKGGDSNGNTNFKGGSGGNSTSLGGIRGYMGSTGSMATSGSDGPTLYDGGGGAGSGHATNRYPTAGGGGGAGGKSFINEDLINIPTVTPGHNSGDGKVVLTLISK